MNRIKPLRSLEGVTNTPKMGQASELGWKGLVTGLVVLFYVVPVKSKEHHED